MEATRAIVEDIAKIDWVSDLDGVSLQKAIDYFTNLKNSNRYLSMRLDFGSGYDGYEAKMYVTRYESDYEIEKRLKKDELRRIKQLECEAREKAKAERLEREEAERKVNREIKERELLAVLKAKYEVTA